MTREQLKNRAEALRTLKAQVNALTEQIEAIEQEIKVDMMISGQNLIDEDDYRFRYTDYKSSAFDQKRFRQEHEDMFAEYLTDRSCKRFTFTIIAH